MLVFDQTFGLFQNHFGDLNVTLGRFIEGRRNDFTFHRTVHVGHFFRAFVNQKNDQIGFRVVFLDRVRNVLQHHGLTGTRRCDDQGTLTFTKRRDKLDHAVGGVLVRAFLINFTLHMQRLIGIQRGQVVKVDAMTDFFRRIEVDLVDLEQREIPFAFLGRPDLAFDRITGTQTKTPHLARTDINVVGAGKIVCLGAAQETETIRQDFKNALTKDGMVVLGQLLENGKHQLLLAERAGIFDFEFIRQSKQLGRRFLFKVLKMHMCV